MNTKSTPVSPGTVFAGVHLLPTPLVLDGATTWKPHHLFAGRTGGMYDWTAHMSALAPGAMPHPPHVHDQEEILLLLAGEADIVVPEAPAAGSDARIRLCAGQFAYYPSRFSHTLQTTSPEAINYLMFRWLNLSAGRHPDELGLGVFDAGAHASAPPGGPAESLASRLVFEGPTAFLPRFHCHLSALAPGTGYEPHVDPYDVAIVLLEGEVETLGQRVEPRAVIAYPAGTAHGMHNPGDTAARYLVFEFQGTATPHWVRAGHLVRRLPRRALRKARRILAAFRPGR